MTPELHEALDALRAFLPEGRGGHGTYCRKENGGSRTMAPIAAAACLCPAPNRVALALLKTHGIAR